MTTSRMETAPATAAPQGATAIKDCRHGKMLFLKRDRYIGRSLDLYGEYSDTELQLFSQLLGPGTLAVEVGSNIGAHTVGLARMVGPRGIVLAFEPQRVIFQILCANVVMNELFNVRTFPVAVGRETGIAKVPPFDYTAQNNFGGVSLQNVADGEEVSLVTIDSLNLPALHFLKVDVEGMESDVLAGAQASIRRHRPLMYVENDRPDGSAQLIGQIADLGYDMWWHMPRLFNPANFNKVAENVFGDIVSCNLVCVPKEAAMVMQGFQKVSGPADRP